jgi:hypothetical protein
LSPSIRAMATAIGFRLFTTLAKFIIQEDPLDGGCQSQQTDIAIFLERLVPLQETVKHDNTPPAGVAGQLQCGALIFLTLLGEVDCCCNLMALNITKHCLGSCRVYPLFSVP